jgi:hypothetical protein
MPDSVHVDNKALVLDLVDWVAARPRPYAEVMEVWRTSCPRLTIWEDAVDHGFVARVASSDGVLLVRATTDGLRFLERERPASRRG